MQRALGSLWTKLEETNSARINEKFDNILLVKNLAEEKAKLEKKYTGLIAEVNKMLDHTVQKVNKEKYGKNKAVMEEYSVQTLKHPRPRDLLGLGTKEAWEFISKIVFTLPSCFFLGVISPLNFVEFDLAPPGKANVFVENLDRTLTIGQVMV